VQLIVYAHLFHRVVGTLSISGEYLCTRETYYKWDINQVQKCVSINVYLLWS